MKRKNDGLSRVEVVVLIVTTMVLAAVFYPLFALTDRLPAGIVRGGDGQPVPGARLRFRDANGRVIAVVNADENGEFRRHGLRALSQRKVDGFALTRYLHSTGGAGAYVFSPLGRQEIAFRDGRGRPVPGVAVSLRPDTRTWQTPATPETLNRVSDANGIIALAGVPLSARWEVYSRDRRYAVQSVGKPRAGSGGVVQSVVTLVVPATITGRLVSATGASLRGYRVVAARDEPGTDARQDGQRHYLANSGSDGRFRLTGLLPGVYQVSATTWRGSRASAPARRARVQSGQVAGVSDLRLEK